MRPLNDRARAGTASAAVSRFMTAHGDVVPSPFPRPAASAGRAATGWAVLLLTGLCGCYPDRVKPATAPAPGEDLPILWEASGTYSRLSRTVRIVARDRATLAQLPIAEVPVDFDSQMVLIAGLGPTPNDKLGIRIKRVWRDGSRIRVLERHIHPGFDQAPGLRPASPWTILVVPRSDLNVEGYSPRVPKGLLDNDLGRR